MTLSVFTRHDLKESKMKRLNPSIHQVFGVCVLVDFCSRNLVLVFAFCCQWFRGLFMMKTSL